MVNNLAINFSSSETVCNCGCGQNILIPDTVSLAQDIRDEACIFFNKDVPMLITSWNRCDKHNKDVGGDTDSLHLYGWAFDFKFIGLYMEESESFIKTYHGSTRYGGLGVYYNRYHCDIGNYRYWRDTAVLI